MVPASLRLGYRWFSIVEYACCSGCFLNFHPLLEDDVEANHEVFSLCTALMILPCASCTTVSSDMPSGMGVLFCLLVVNNWCVCVLVFLFFAAFVAAAMHFVALFGASAWMFAVSR